MGAHLVAQVLAHWTDLSDRAFRVLVRMAVTALDKPQNGQPANIYRGGRELLAMSLRSKGGSDRTRNRTVAEAVAELSEAGAIQHLVTGWAGQKAVYRLTLDRAHAIGDSQSKQNRMGGSTPHPEDVPTAHPMDVPSGTEMDVPTPHPKENEEFLEELAEEESVDLRTTSHPPRATAEPTNPDSSPRPKKCTHGLGGGLRRDGLPECALCRRALKRPGIYRPPPPGEQDLADVIPLDSWRTA